MVTLPLALLAIPSVMIGYLTIEPMLYGDFFKGVIFVNHEAHPVMEEMASEFHGAFAMAMHAATSPVFWLALAGVVLSWFFYLKRPSIPAAIKQASGPIYTLLENKYYFDKFNEVVLAGRLLGKGLWKGGDRSDRRPHRRRRGARGWNRGDADALLQSGHIYHYAFTMIFGVCALLSFWLLRA